MHKTVIMYNMIKYYTLQKKGEKSISEKTGVKDEIKVSVALTISATSENFTVYAVFKGVPGAKVYKDLQKLPIVKSKGVCVHTQKIAWSESEKM